MKRFRSWIIGSLIVLVLAAAAPSATATPKAPANFYLVGLRDGASARGLSDAGFDVRQVWPGLGAAQVQVDATHLARLHAYPAVAYVEMDRTIALRNHGGSDVDKGELTWGVQMVHAPNAWKLGSTGKGIKVCVLDSGIDASHPEFQNGVIKGARNFVHDGHPDAQDGNGHGTHVAGTIAAQLNKKGVAGVAHGVELYIARVLDDDGEGSTSALVNGVTWCVDTVHAHILNLSFGKDEPLRTEQALFDDAYRKGVLSFAASGNDGTDQVGYPAGYDSVVAVGAVNAKLNLASFSSFGPDQELVAPGVHVLSSILVGSGLKTIASKGKTTYPSSIVRYSATGTVLGSLVDCGLAQAARSCARKPVKGKWIAVIKRGTTNFADKLSNVMAQGASGAIIANNDTAAPKETGMFTLRSAAQWIPTVSVSYDSGVSMRQGGLGTGKVAVERWDYAYEDGTSMASPHAAAVAALAWSANPGLSNTQVRTVLRTSAKDLGVPGKDSTFGYGLIEASAAVTLARSTVAAG